jgi:GNAT superfamily N-acetyltransferase
MMKSGYSIRPIGAETIEDSGALDLVWRVFSRFEAPEYTLEGIGEFKAYIELDVVKEKISAGTLKFWGCFFEDAVVGVIAMRPPCHVSLLFVDAGHQRQGIARALFDTALESYQEQRRPMEVTVNSSPFAVDIYRRLGFIPTDTEQELNGIRYTPMKYIAKKGESL